MEKHSGDVLGRIHVAIPHPSASFAVADGKDTWWVCLSRGVTFAAHRDQIVAALTCPLRRSRWVSGFMTTAIRTYAARAHLARHDDSHVSPEVLEETLHRHRPLSTHRGCKGSGSVRHYDVLLLQLGILLDSLRESHLRVLGVLSRDGIEAVEVEPVFEPRDIVAVFDHTENVKVGEFYTFMYDPVEPVNGAAEDAT